MARLGQRLERAVKTTSVRFLRANLRFKRAFRRRGRTVFITAMPKSASTFLVATLAEVTGFLQHFLGYDFLNEQDLYLPRLIDAYDMDVVAHQHTRATPKNLELMQNFAIRPVVLTRPLPDIAVSLLDHIHRESRITSVFHPGPDFGALSRDRQLDAVVDLAMPWFVQFYAGWREATEAGAVEILFLDYAELVGAPEETVARVLAFHELPAPPEAEIAEAVARVQGGGRARFNKGVTGRGAAGLSPAQHDRLAALVRHYPAVDFGPVLPPALPSAAVAPGR
ncbi:MAG: hypothetical protein QNJ94_09900 [Alphaproteobacteria bacterium]|nr:hypothetical protein [Alphaproteobacteria bacterium]